MPEGERIILRRAGPAQLEWAIERVVRDVNWLIDAGYLRLERCGEHAPKSDEESKG